MSDFAIYNFDDAAVKKLLLESIRHKRGIHRVCIQKVRDQRTLKQNASLWVHWYVHLAMAISEAWGETVTTGKHPTDKSVGFLAANL